MSDIVEKVKIKYESLVQFLDEKTLRIWAAVEAKSLDKSGISKVSEATSLSRTTIYAGLKELSSGESETVTDKRIRKRGGGRRKITEKDTALLTALESLLEPVTRGDPESPLRWTCKSTVKLAKELQHMGHEISQRAVCDLLHGLGYSLQSNRKVKEGSVHKDRNEQFLYISRNVREFQDQGEPVVSVDTKKKEIIGEFKNNGREWNKKGEPVKVNVHDFPDSEKGKVVPYGVYDITSNKGWVSVGINHDTSEFAVESIRRWWYEMGMLMYPNASKLLITADCGGSNGRRTRLWKSELQNLADELKITVHVCHFPPGTSKWNKIEHRMFCHITKNWRGRPLTSREVVVNLISSTTTRKGLEIKAGLDTNDYKTKIKIPDKDFKAIALEKDNFHGEWNYRIYPKNYI